jgi:kynurenine formamidase
MKKLLLFVNALIMLTACQQEKKTSFSMEGIKWVDLTYAFDSSTLYWPNNIKHFEHSTDAEGITPLGFYYSSYSICTPEHGGTHLDAPIHFAKNRMTVDELPIEALTGNAIVIDVSKKALLNRDYLISITDIEEWEKTNGEIPANTIVLFRTGYGQFYPNREKYFGSAKTGPEAIPELHFPGIDPETTKWLIEKRNIKSLGLDTPSIDYGQSKDFKTHQILLEKNKPGFENVANLDKLPVRDFFIIALPMKIAKGSGAPLRIVAGINP